MTFDTVASMIAKQLKLNVSDITPDKRLVEDLHADSANVMVMIMDMEDTFNITVEDDAMGGVSDFHIAASLAVGLAAVVVDRVALQRLSVARDDERAVI